MGRQWKRYREKYGRRALISSGCGRIEDPKHPDRAEQLEEELDDLADGDAVFWTSPDCPADVRESNLEDILAFESVGSGISLFEGLKLNGVDLPAPEKLDGLQSEKKVMEVLNALADLRIFLVGFENMSGAEFYSTLWNQTLWEGCYVRKRNPGALTLIDVSHKMMRSDLLQFLENLKKADLIQ